MTKTPQIPVGLLQAPAPPLTVDGRLDLAALSAKELAELLERAQANLEKAEAYKSRLAAGSNVHLTFNPVLDSVFIALTWLMNHRKTAQEMRADPEAFRQRSIAQIRLIMNEIVRRRGESQRRGQ
ncbi:hypothetical protein [Phreatobacter sp. AB_2022a]|uniref:hypothetical protein n=1 Tax=Phreatobacter sp. AB_2022a TaxID=3003134 RepID=UPI002286FE1D|nr:hypothetical protein [Phreatobacter sp. AB_2022a]MCZ0733770.1 hypothetical protein [Phreatobacter sp. AB_2022a]